MTRPVPSWTPPTRDGVGPSRVAVSGGPWASVAEFLSARLRPGIDWRARLAAGEVLDATGRPVAPDAPCPPQAVFWYWRSLPPEPRVPFEIGLLHQDEDLVVVDKPHFLPVTPGGRHLQETVLVRLKRQLGLDTLVPLHRLDLETAGVLVFTVRPESRGAYHALMRERRARKVYEAVAPFRADLTLPCEVSDRLEECPGDGFMQMQSVAGEPNAHSRIELLRRLPDGADGQARGLYRLTPHTGRKHQLRVHMADRGLPLEGDRIYPVLWPEPGPEAPRDFSRPLQLLARELSFVDPVRGVERCFTSRLQLAGAGDLPGDRAEDQAGA